MRCGSWAREGKADYMFSLRPLVRYAVTAWVVLYDALAALIEAFKLVEAWGLTSSRLVMK